LSSLITDVVQEQSKPTAKKQNVRNEVISLYKTTTATYIPNTVIVPYLRRAMHFLVTCTWQQMRFRSTHQLERGGERADACDFFWWSFEEIPFQSFANSPEIQGKFEGNSGEYLAC
jgi:hypothetical protein